MKTILSKLFFSVALVFGAAATHAQVIPAAYTMPAAPEAGPVVTYLGSGDEEMSFNLKYENAAGARFLVSILDKDGEVLFDQVFTDKKFSKTFKIPSDLGRLSFVIRDIKTRAEKKIDVSTERRFVEEVSVTKVH